MFESIVLGDVVSTIFFSLLGLGLLGLCWMAISAMSPFSIRKEIEEDHNTALAVLISAVFIAMAIIIAAVIVS